MNSDKIYSLHIIAIPLTDNLITVISEYILTIEAPDRSRSSSILWLTSLFLKQCNVKYEGQVFQAHLNITFVTFINW